VDLRNQDADSPLRAPCIFREGSNQRALLETDTISQCRRARKSCSSAVEAMTVAEGYVNLGQDGICLRGRNGADFRHSWKCLAEAKADRGGLRKREANVTFRC
jgi:hypothetical protein